MSDTEHDPIPWWALAIGYGIWGIAIAIAIPAVILIKIGRRLEGR